MTPWAAAVFSTPDRRTRAIQVSSRRGPGIAGRVERAGRPGRPDLRYRCLLAVRPDRPARHIPGRTSGPWLSIPPGLAGLAATAVLLVTLAQSAAPPVAMRWRTPPRPAWRI